MKSQPSPSDLNHNRLVVEQVIADVMKSAPKQPGKSQEEEVIDKANIITQEVFYRFRTMHNLSVVPMKFDDAVHHIYDLYKSRYASWTKDELLLLVSLQQAVLGAESFRDTLI